MLRGIFSRLPVISALIGGAMLWSVCSTAEDFDYYTPRILDQSKCDAPFLPDFSYAGYHWGEQPIPQHPPTLNVADFGAVPDDGQDDTAAILAAVEAAHQEEGTAVVRFPPGRFILSEIVWIERSHFVLQGSGSGDGGTIIELPRPLWDMDLGRVSEYAVVKQWLGARHEEQARSIFSFQYGVIWTRAPDRGARQAVADVRSGKRDGHELIVDASRPLETGGVYRVVRTDPDAPGSLLDHVMGGVEIESGTRTQRMPITEYVTIEAIRGNRITVKEPLFHDVRAEWPTKLEKVAFLEEVGVEAMRFECAGREAYAGHGRERGYNPIGFANVRNSWVRDVAVDNADSAIMMRSGYLVTFEDVTVTGEAGAHYGVQIGVSQRCLARNISADMSAIHVLSVNSLAHGNVFTDCVVRTGRLDQHTGLNWQNLFDDIVVREAEHGWGVFGHGGGGDMSPLHAAYNTFWNIRLIYPTETIEDIPHPLFGSIIPGAAVRLVCFRANVPLRIHYYNVDAYIEGTNRVIADEYASLYKWQLAQRLGDSHPAVERIRSELEIELTTDTLEAQPEREVEIRAFLHNRAFNRVSLLNPGDSGALLYWEIRPLDAQAHQHMAPHAEDAAANVEAPGAEYNMYAGTSKVLSSWLPAVSFPGPGLYEVVLVYENAQCRGVAIRSNSLVFRVTSDE